MSYFSELREESGYTIQELAAITNIPISYMLDLEHGNSKHLINSGRIYVLADYLDIDVAELSDLITGDLD